MILVAPAGARLSRSPALLALILALLWPHGAGAAEEGGEGVDWLGDWIPSVGVSAGFASRDTKGTIGGGVEDFQPGSFGLPPTVVENGIRTRTTTSLVTTCISGQDRPQNNALCEYFDENDTTLDGFVLSGGAQLLAPALNPLPLRPRLMFQGAYGDPATGRVVAADGFKPISFEAIGGEPKVRLELKGRPESVWWAGGGVALQLPFDRYRTWLKLTVNYSEESLQTKARIDADLGGLKTEKATEDLTIKSIAPGIGVEAEIARLGPMSVSLAADTLISISLNQPKATYTDAAGEPTFIAPDPSNNGSRVGGPIIVEYKPGDVSVFGGVSIRFNWVGFER